MAHPPSVSLALVCTENWHNTCICYIFLLLGTKTSYVREKIQSVAKCATPDKRSDTHTKATDTNPQCHILRSGARQPVLCVGDL